VQQQMQQQQQASSGRRLSPAAAAANAGNEVGIGLINFYCAYFFFSHSNVIFVSFSGLLHYEVEALTI
jgi:hypothetical protein